MRIRLAIIDNDRDYLIRIKNYFTKHFADNFEVRIFSNINYFWQDKMNLDVDIILMDEAFVEYINWLQGRRAVIMTADSTITEIAGLKAIGKYQKAEEISRSIREFYQDEIGTTVKRKCTNRAEVIGFTNAAGGVGTTTVAVAFALEKSKANKKVFYLDFNANSNIQLFLSGENKHGLEKSIFTIKSGRALGADVERFICKDASGIDFFYGIENMSDMIDVLPAHANEIIDSIANTQLYDYIVVDINNNCSDFALKVLDRCDRVVIIADGWETSRLKTSNMIKAMCVKDRIVADRIEKTWGVFYNKYPSKNGVDIDDLGIVRIGGTNRFKECTEKEIAYEISSRRIFEEY